MRLNSLLSFAISLFILGAAGPSFAICGDGAFEAGEGCDDGGLDNGDGCGYACYVEPGYRCPTGTSCEPICSCLVLLEDDFDDNLPDLSKLSWLADHNAGAEITEADQMLTLHNGAWVASDSELEPIAAGALYIRATWYVGADDEVAIFTRGQLVQDASGSPQGAGAHFFASEADDQISIAIPGAAPVTAALTIEPGDELWFEIEDDGEGVSLRVTNWPAGGMGTGAGPAPMAEISATSIERYADNYVIFTNRAATGDVDHTSMLDNILIASLNVFECKSTTCPGGVCETAFTAVDTGCDDYDDTTGGDVCDGLGECKGVLITCGDGVRDPGEECDDGEDNDDTDPNNCRTNCVAAHCGDEVIDYGEQCDDGLANSDTAVDACRTNCRNARCGDGALDTGEVCDDNNASSGDGCTNNCSAVEDGWYCDTTPCHTECGDEIIAGAEECDNGVALNSDSAPDACRATTCLEAHCGDYVIDEGEECDDGLANSDTLPDTCRSNCMDPHCGDGVIDAGEGCDDGNTAPNDGCDWFCEAYEEGWSCSSEGCVAICGDGMMVGDEACDDGDDNGYAADGCRPDCTAARCGDGVMDTDEDCDDGNLENNDTCLNGCTAATCGDGYLNDIEEQCDTGLDNSDTEADACRLDCTRADCGDGIVDSNEECDDGNLASQDGCTSFCTIEEAPATGGTGGTGGEEPSGCAATPGTNSGTTAAVLALFLLGLGWRRRR